MRWMCLGQELGQRSQPTHGISLVLLHIGSDNVPTGLCRTLATCSMAALLHRPAMSRGRDFGLSGVGQAE